jgi:RHS repeat-associated protein
VYEWGSSALNSRKFTGYERDGATRLDYANARMYNSGRGRFMQPDPAGLNSSNARNPESLNRYSYVQNDPVNSIDPTGLDTEICEDKYIWIDNGFRQWIWSNRTCETLGSGSYQYSRDAQSRNGGGGGSSNIFQTALQKLLVDKLTEALNILKNNKDCQKLLDSSLKDIGEYSSSGVLLESIIGNNDYEILTDGGSPASMNGVGDEAKLKIRRSFFSIPDGGKIQVMIDDKLVDVSLGEMQVISILHELGHGTGKYTHDKDMVGKPYQELVGNDKLNGDVAKTCLGKK